MIDVFVYLDCRSYLRDFYRERSALDPKFSHRYICSRLGQGPGSRSYFNNILAGRVRISPNLVTRLVSLLGLDKDRATYFRLLVLFSQSDSAEEKDVLFEQLIKANKSDTPIINPDTFTYFRKWYNIAIRELLDFFPFYEDYTALAGALRPSISAAQAKEAIEFLEGAGLIRKDVAGQYKSVEKSITTGSQSESFLINAYQIACMDLAKLSLAENFILPQNFSTLTMSVSAQAYHQIEKKLAKLRAEVVFLVGKDQNPSERVYQFNFQLFPVSK